MRGISICVLKSNILNISRLVVNSKKDKYKRHKQFKKEKISLLNKQVKNIQFYLVVKTANEYLKLFLTSGKGFPSS